MSAAADAIAPWAKKYQWLPWREKGRGLDGVDCWGLVWLIFRQEAGIELPSYANDYCRASAADRQHLAALIAREKNALPFFPLAARHEGEDAAAFAGRLKALARPFDVLHLAQMGELCHVGVGIGGDCFLHIQKDKGVVMNRFDSERWRGRLAQGGIYRHRLLEGK